MDDDLSQQTIGFVGAGQMARALASGFVRAGLVTGRQIIAADPSPAALQTFAGEVSGCRVLESNIAVVEAATSVFLAVKPQVLSSALSFSGHLPVAGKLFVSIVAGVPLSTLTARLTSERVIRVMPNTPCLIGQGAAGYSLASGATQADANLVARLLGSVGEAFCLPEAQLDAVTGLSGSGPAFVYQVIEALADGGVLVGLPREVALRLAANTVAGAAQMVLKSNEHPAALKDRVTSPGGTTIRGLLELEKGGLRAALMSAVGAATARSRELGAQASSHRDSPAHKGD